MTVAKFALWGLGGLLLFAAGAGGQTPATHADTAAHHHACLDAEQAAIEQGEGFGMALVADRNGFPGPRHILDLREELELAPAQQEQVQRLFDRMHAQAVDVGKQLLANEAELDRLLAQPAPDETQVRSLVDAGGALRAELRWVHLSTHLEARPLLTPHQLHLYAMLRHGAHPHTR